MEGYQIQGENGERGDHCEHKEESNSKICPTTCGDSEVETESMAAASQLITNLGHELEDVRLRALKCLWRKIECGLVSGEAICRKTDFINRLSPWIRTFPCSKNEECEEGFELLIRLCSKLSGNEEFRKAFVSNHLDTVLSKRRLECSKDLRSAINQLLDKVGSFYIHCEGPADDTWDGNLSAPHPYSTEKIHSGNMSYKSIDFEEPNYDFDAPYQDFYTAGPKNGRQIQSKYPVPDWKKQKVSQVVGIKTVQLGTSDRRVLTSAVESLSSKNENLVMMTCCFIRDVLLNDFPPEVFIQESAVSMSLIQVVQDSWIDDRVNHIAYQALLKLTVLLRMRLTMLNTSDLWVYEPSSSHEFKGPQGYYGDAYTTSTSELTTSSSMYFAGNICKILRMLSRSILYDSNRVTRWVLLESFVKTFLKCTKTYPNVQSKNIMMLVQEVLYDLKSSDTYSSAYSSRPLAPFQPMNDEEMLQTEFLLDSVAYSYQTRLKDNAWDSTEKYIIALLHDIQNSTGHKGVFDAINRMREHCLVLILKSTKSQRKSESKRQTESPRDTEPASFFNDPNWRDSFYRFLSVEPTSREDEELLTRVLDLLCFILSSIDQSSPLLEWIVPLCGTKGCTTLRLLIQHCGSPNSDSGGTTLSSFARTLLDFYEIIRQNMSQAENRSDLFWALIQTYAQAMHNAAESSFSSPAITYCVLRELSYLTSEESVICTMQKNMNFMQGLLNRVNDALSAFSERWTQGSYRNQGIVRYATLSILHLMSALRPLAGESECWEWIGKCITNLPFLWSSDDTETKAAGFQICGIICTSKNGAKALVSEINPPTLIWSVAYRELVNPAEAPIVQQAAALAILRLTACWKDIVPHMKHTDSIPIRSTDYINDMMTLVGCVYWHNRLNRCKGKDGLKEQSVGSEESLSLYSTSPTIKSAREPVTETSDFPAFITPNVLNLLCKILVRILKGDEDVEETSESVKSALTNSGISSLLFRLMENREVMSAGDITEYQWLRCCSALSTVIETLTVMCRFDPSTAVVLIGDKRSLSNMVQLLATEPMLNASQKCEECLNVTWINIYSLLSILSVNAGKNFEDFERNVWNHWSKLFEKLIFWLQSDSPVKCRQISLHFSCSFLSMLAKHHDIRDEGTHHPVLCLKKWERTQMSYGRSWLQSLMNIWTESLDVEERINVLRAITVLISLSPDAKEYANENQYTKIFSTKIRNMGVKFSELSDMSAKSKTTEQIREEIIWILNVISVLLYMCKPAREALLQGNFPDNIHKIFKTWIMAPDRNCFHILLECLLNFTEEFPRGSHALTLTTSVIGVAARKSASPQSLFQEVLNILQHEMDNVEKSSNLKTVDLCFSLIRNASFSAECRAVLSKSQLFSFIRRLHMNETKRWGPKQNHVKLQFLQFLVHITIYTDIQLLLPKINESLEILLALTSELTPVSLVALQILRNLSFHPGNRPRFLCDSGFIPTLALKLRTSNSHEELESAGVTLWAIVANSEKGKLCAKQFSCAPYLHGAMQRLLQLQKKSNDLSTEKRDFSALIGILAKVSSILGEST